MEDGSKDTQCGIIDDLNDIERICANPDLSPGDVETLYSKYTLAIAWIDEHVKSIEPETALQLLEFLKHFFEVS